MIIRRLTILLVVATATANFMVAAGVVDVYGIDPEPGPDVESSVEEGNQSASNIDDEQIGFAESVVGAAITAVDALENISQVPLAAPLLMLNLGVPGFIVTFIFAPLYIALGIDLVSVIRGMEIR